MAEAPAAVVTDHGALTGLADDDHTQYILATGARSFTGSVLIDGSGASAAQRLGIFNSIGGIELRQQGTSLASIFQLDNTGATEDEWIRFTRNGGLEFRHNNLLALATLTTGIRVQDTSGNDPLIYFYDDADATLSRLQHLSNDLTMWNETDSGWVRLRGRDAASADQYLLNLDPDTGMGYAGNGLKALAHVPIASGQGASPTFWWESQAQGDSGALDQDSGGLMLTANGMNTTSRHTPALLFGSTDSAFTTVDPKTLAEVLSPPLRGCRTGLEPDGQCFQKLSSAFRLSGSSRLPPAGQHLQSYSQIGCLQRRSGPLRPLDQRHCVARKSVLESQIFEFLRICQPVEIRMQHPAPVDIVRFEQGIGRTRDTAVVSQLFQETANERGLPGTEAALQHDQPGPGPVPDPLCKLTAQGLGRRGVLKYPD